MNGVFSSWREIQPYNQGDRGEKAGYVAIGKGVLGRVSCCDMLFGDPRTSVGETQTGEGDRLGDSDWDSVVSSILDL